MLILHEGELLHTDSSTDILEHYGVKGMKWGKRLRVAAGQFTGGRLNIKNKDYKLGAKYGKFKKSQKKSYKNAKRKLNDTYDKRVYDRKKKFEFDNYDDIKNSRAKNDLYNKIFKDQPDRHKTESNWYSARTKDSRERLDQVNGKDYNRTQSEIHKQKQAYKKSLNEFKKKNFR